MTPRSRSFEPLAALLLALVVLGSTQVPWVWAMRADARRSFPGQVFTGALPTYADDAASYWSWMGQARDGQFFFTDRYTPENHPRNYVNVLFWALGTASRVSGAPVALVYGLARVLLGALLAWLLYVLAGRLFTRPGERIACYFLLLVSGGWEGIACYMERNHGWSHLSSPAWWTPEMSTFFSMMLFPHFIAGFVCMIVVVLLMMRAWSAASLGPKERLWAALGAGGVLFALTFFHPYDVVPLMGTLWLAPVLFGLVEGRVPLEEARLSLVATVVWLPAFVYNLQIFSTNPAMRGWDLQNIMITPPPGKLLIAFGAAGLLAVLGLWTLRRMSRPSLIMVAWLIATLAIIHLPLRFQRRAIGGIQFPIGALATLGLVGVAIPAVHRLVRLLRNRKHLPGAPTEPGGAAIGWGRDALVAIALLAPIVGATPWYLRDIEWKALRTARYPSWIQTEQDQALRALGRLSPADAVTLSSYEMGNLIPAISGTRCFLGHYALTIDSLAKRRSVIRFFSTGPEHDSWRIGFLRHWRIRYILDTPAERSLGAFNPATRSWLTLVFATGGNEERASKIYEVVLPGSDPGESSSDEVLSPGE